MTHSKLTTFTKEQLQILNQNPYTYKASERRIVFTVAFKEFFYDQAFNHHRKTREIFRDAGYDDSYFEKARLCQIRRVILAEGNSEEGFKNPRGMSKAEQIAAFAEKDLTRQRTETTLKEMQERISDLEAQVEFLKKIQFIRNRKKK